jgi:dihydrofolate synthase / folylpolyglutamate synthase
MRFEETVQYLLGLGHETLTMKLGLRSTELLLGRLKNPELAFPAVQIAGTNGKGSVATVLDSICRAASIKTGLYTSPHLVSITERIRIDGVEITPGNFAKHATSVRVAAQQLLDSGQIQALPTFFEQLTAIALLAFRDSGIQLAILETGLGGRLDSTSAVKAQLVGITQIALDHEEYLGSTIEEIAAEKAAIIRPGVQAVLAKQTPPALSVILRQCEVAGVDPVYEQCQAQVEEITGDGVFCVTLTTSVDTYEKIWLALRGRHQIDNVAVAVQLAERLRGFKFWIPREAIVSGVEQARHPGRLELLEGHPGFLLDGAHNPAGARMLRDYLDQFGVRPLIVLFGAMRDKQVEELTRILFSAADHVVLTAVDNPRAATVGALLQLAKRFISEERLSVSTSSTEALDLALEKAAGKGIICVTGSLYLIGELRPSILKEAGFPVA